MDGTLYVLNPEGTLRWKFTTCGYIESSPAIDENGTIYLAAFVPLSHGYLYTIEILDNTAPEIPNLNGPIKGQPLRKYTYTAVTNDPDGDDVSYFFDWDDNLTSGWLGPVDSGSTVASKHAWTVEGIYEIKVRAKDDNGAEGDWAIFEVNISKGKSLSFNSFFHWFLEEHPRLFPILRQILGL